MHDEYILMTHLIHLVFQKWSQQSEMWQVTPTGLKR